MPHKKPKSKQAAIQHPDLAAKETAKASSSIGPQSLMSAKHHLSDETDKATASDRLEKRRKINSNTGLHHPDPPSSSLPVTTSIEDVQRPEFAPGASTQELPHEVRHLSTKYNFTMVSILSSAKISDKVEKLLLRVEDFSFADPKSKPGVVVLHAKSEVASKMVSIVEIARQDIERDKGKWWQYSKVDGQIAELKVKPVKRRDGGKTCSEWQKEQAGVESQDFEEAEGGTGRTSKEAEHAHEVVEGDEEMDDEFEAMANLKEVDQGEKQPGNDSGRKIRAIPVMTIYFARVPVPGLKELYGYALIPSMDANY